MAPRQAVLFPLAFLFSALAYVCIVPPYEGFDETAHYSYISFLSDRRGIPDFRSTPLDRTVDVDRQALPQPYAAEPPYEKNGGLTYRNFFREDGQKQILASRKFRSKPEKRVFYEPAVAPNWEGQHPPLYYFLMRYPYRLLARTSPATRLLGLRLSSVFLVLLSWFAAYRIAGLSKDREVRQHFWSGGLAILFFPTFFYDTARIGNDSLCALLFAGCFYALLSLYGSRRPLFAWVSLGLFLGLGLWTKAVFIPLGAALLAFAFWIEIRYHQAPWTRACLNTAAAAGIALLIGSGWFIFFYRRYGNLSLSYDLYFLPANRPPADWMKAAAHFARLSGSLMETFLWSGTWSWVRRPSLDYFLLAPALSFAVYRALSFFRRQNGRELKWVMAAAAAPVGGMLAGLFFYMGLQALYIGEDASVSGHYLFLAWPALGLVLSSALQPCQTRAEKLGCVFFLASLWCFEMAGAWRLGLVYSGFLVKAGHLEYGTGFVLPSFSILSSMAERLRLIAYPDWALAFYAAGLFLKLILAKRLIWDSPGEGEKTAQRNTGWME